MEDSLCIIFLEVACYVVYEYRVEVAVSIIILNPPPTHTHTHTVSHCLQGGASRECCSQEESCRVGGQKVVMSQLAPTNLVMYTLSALGNDIVKNFFF